MPRTSAEVEDLAGRSLDERVRDWWEGLREQVAMTTFYLFDPESWR